MMGPFGAGRVGGMKKAKGHRHSKKLYIEQDKLQEDSVKLSVSRIAQSICYELGEEPNFDDLLIIGAMVTGRTSAVIQWVRKQGSNSVPGYPTRKR